MIVLFVMATRIKVGIVIVVILGTTVIELVIVPYGDVLFDKLSIWSLEAWLAFTETRRWSSHVTLLSYVFLLIIRTSLMLYWFIQLIERTG